MITLSLSKNCAEKIKIRSSTVLSQGQLLPKFPGPNLDSMALVLASHGAFFIVPVSGHLFFLLLALLLFGLGPPWAKLQGLAQGGPPQSRVLSSQGAASWVDRQNLPRGLHMFRWDLGKGPRADFYKAQIHQWAVSLGGRVNFSHPFIGHVTKSPFINGFLIEDAIELPKIPLEVGGRAEWVRCFYIPWNLSEPLPDPYDNVNFTVAVPNGTYDHFPRRDFSYRLRVSQQHNSWLEDSSTRKALGDIVADSPHMPDYIKDLFSHE